MPSTSSSDQRGLVALAALVVAGVVGTSRMAAGVAHLLFAALLLAGGTTFLLIGSYLLFALFVQRVWRLGRVPGRACSHMRRRWSR